MDRQKSREAYAELRELHRMVPAAVPAEARAEARAEAQTAEREEDAVAAVASPGELAATGPASGLLPGFAALLEQNEDMVGWIRIEGTSIDYPVVQGEDNAFYLDHGFDGKRSRSGAIFMDYRNDPGTQAGRRNIVLYGHHMKDGTMFKGLTHYLDRDFFELHRKFSFNLLNEEIEWEIFAVYTTDVAFNYIRTSFADDRDFAQFLQGMAGRSIYRTDILPGREDEILTLSTCDYASENGRLVVQARRMQSAS